MRRGLGRRVLLTAAGVALAPTSLAALADAALALSSLASRARSARWFLGAFAAYGVLHAAGLLRLRPAYVFAHESAHALAAWLSGEKVHRFVVGWDRGHVDLSRVNVFIALAPYWLPLYALVSVLLYRVLLWVRVPVPNAAFLTVMGLSLSFHVCHTIQSLRSRQSDLDHAGFVLSLAAIVLLNSAVVLLAAKGLFPGAVRLGESAASVGERTMRFWEWAGRAASLIPI